MSRTPSRERRKEAVNRAREDAYRLDGAAMPEPPFDNERQNRIYEKYYSAFAQSLRLFC